MQRPNRRPREKQTPERGVGDTAATPAGTVPASASSPSLPPGTRLADRYAVVGLLGRGGMGEVYEALDLALAIPVALKILHPTLARDPRALRRFKCEVLLARSITHTNVCRIYDLGWAEDRGREVSFLTMELLRGETLAARVKARGRLATAEALPLVRQMSAALEAAHRAGVVHRDFKSGNVMLVPGPEGERAVVTDFGLALPAAESAVAGEALAGDVAGTPAYMAPEQVRGERAGPAADIYALGVVLFEAVTGRLPFLGDGPLATAEMRLTADPPRPRSLVPELDPHWEEAILRCLSREPQRRFARAEEVVAALLGERRAAARHALPAERDAFVGREAELAALDRHFEGGAPLVTLVGPAGAGKTRLGLSYGRRSSARFPGGVWFCDLTQAQTVDGIASAVATALDVPLGAGDPFVQLGHVIAARGRCLVILDNFEQVVAHAQATVGRWPERMEEACFLATSRERLRLDGEVMLSLGPLDEETAVALFVNRAAATRPGFVLDQGNEEAVRRVVHLLEGLPLAIELAAARVGMMTPAKILERLTDRFRLLARANESGRHASLRAAIDGTWELLLAWEKAAFAQASVFEGGFTLEAAEAVLDLSAWPEAPWTVDVVQALVDKSLLKISVPEGAYGEPRFGMYVSLQEYARGKLGEEGAVERAGSGNEAQRRTEERHGAYFGGFGTEEACEALHLHGGVERMRALIREIENLVAACRRAVARGDGATAVGAYGAAWEVLKLRGPFLAGVALGASILDVAGLAAPTRGRVLRNVGVACLSAGRMDEARAHYEQALAIHREVGNRRDEGIALTMLADLDRQQGRMEEARAHCKQALAVHRELGERRFEGKALCTLGILHAEQGRMDEARAQWEQVLAICRELDDRPTEGVVLGNLGALHLEQGRMDEARAHYERALAIHRDVGNRKSEGFVLGHVGNLHAAQGRMDEARANFEQALAIHRDVGNRSSEGLVLGNLGALHLEQGRMEEACAHFEQALAIHREVGDRRSEGRTLLNLGVMHAEQGRMDEARANFEQALAIHRGIGYPQGVGQVLGRLGKFHARAGHFGNAWTAFEGGERILRGVGACHDLGIFLCARGEADNAAGDLVRASAALAEATSLAVKIGAGPASELGRAVAALGQALAEDAAASAEAPPRSRAGKRRP